MLDYFRPRRFERIHGRSIYSYLGIDFFKKHLLLTDLILFRAGNRHQMDVRGAGRASELKRLEWQTRRDETIHIMFMIVIAIMVVLNSGRLSNGQWLAIAFINLYANVYPIFLQRHNRMRLLRVMNGSLCKCG